MGEGGISGQDRDEMSQGGSDPTDPPFLKIRLVTPWLILGKGGRGGRYPYLSSLWTCPEPAIAYRSDGFVERRENPCLARV